jgi:nucleoside-diphosphate-sugar epimerase
MMPDATRTVAVTGATGFLGRHVAHRLVGQGMRLVNLTGHPGPGTARNDGIRTEMLDFAQPSRLTEAMAGASVLVNTYWVRFERGTTTYSGALRNTERLLDAARAAGVERVVHVSITNPSLDSALPYFAGKARAEEAVRGSGMRWAIVRPTIIYGPRDVLLNNIAWALRHLPGFGIPGDGTYPIQPVFVDDLADLIVALSDSDAAPGSVTDAAGPERYTFAELVRVIRWAVGSHALVVNVPPLLALAGAGVIGALTRDVTLTAEELRGLMAGLLVSDGPAVGHTSLAQWVLHNRDTVGRRYASELDRHYRPAAA